MKSFLQVKGNGRIIIFSDVHFGKSRDSHLKLDATTATVQWIVEQVLQQDAKTVFFLGDFFNNRSYLNVHTLNRAYESLKSLCNVANVYFIIGNHDLYLKASSDIHSLAPFESLENFFYIDKPTEVGLPGGKSALMCPWHWDLKEYAMKDYDYLFGHFEPSGAAMTGSEYSTGKYTMGDLVRLAPKVFSGHYHIHKEYPIDCDVGRGLMRMVGAPLQLDWGDYGNTKGIYLLDVNKDECTFIENPVSPRYIKFNYSALLDDTQKVDENVKGNIVKVVVDCEYSYGDVALVFDLIKKYEPRQLDAPDFIFSMSKNLLLGLKFGTKFDMSMTKFDYMKQFIEKLTLPENIDKNEIMSITSVYYNRCENDEKVEVEDL